MSDDEEAPEKAKIEVYETDLTMGIIRWNYTVELQSNKHDAIKLRDEAVATIKEIMTQRRVIIKGVTDEAYM